VALSHFEVTLLTGYACVRHRSLNTTHKPGFLKIHSVSTLSLSSPLISFPFLSFPFLSFPFLSLLTVSGSSTELAQPHHPTSALIPHRSIASAFDPTISHISSISRYNITKSPSTMHTLDGALTDHVNSRMHLHLNSTSTTTTTHHLFIYLRNTPIIAYVRPRRTTMLEHGYICDTAYRLASCTSHRSALTAYTHGAGGQSVFARGLPCVAVILQSACGATVAAGLTPICNRSGERQKEVETQFTRLLAYTVYIFTTSTQRLHLAWNIMDGKGMYNHVGLDGWLRW